MPLAPIPPDVSPQCYFPTVVGTKWTYDDNLDREEGGYGEVITKSEKKDGRFIVTVKSTSLDWKDTEATTICQYLVSEDGIFEMAAFLESAERKRSFEPPIYWLKLPHKVGAKWNAQDNSKVPMVAGKVESIKVPAGKFEAIRVDQGPKCTYWYAPGVGRVKSVINDKVTQMKSITFPIE